MHVLMISLDTTFLAEEGTARGDTLLRHIEIAKMLSHLHVIVFSVGKARRAVFRPMEKLTVYPTQSLNKVTRVFDAFHIGSRICRRHRIDVMTTQDVFFTGMVGWALRALYQIPLNVQVHADFFGNRYWIKERLLNRLLHVTGKIILRRADNVRVVNRSLKENMIRLGIPEGRVWHVFGGGGIDVEKFSAADGSSIRKRHLPAGCERMALFAGRVTKQKRVTDLLYAAGRVRRELPETAFLIAGEGKELPRAKALCSRLGLDDRVVFAGNVPYDEMPRYFAAADIFALASGYEASPRVLMESVAAGLPIVATRVSGVSELVAEGKNGHIVPVGRPPELAEKLVRVLKNIERYRQGAARQRSILELYNRRRNLPRLLEIYSQIAREKRR
jgi:glycosyltransferase involved in cell wall biosynthesis